MKVDNPYKDLERLSLSMLKKNLPQMFTTMQDQDGAVLYWAAAFKKYEDGTLTSGDVALLKETLSCLH